MAILFTEGWWKEETGARPPPEAHFPALLTALGGYSLGGVDEDYQGLISKWSLCKASFAAALQSEGDTEVASPKQPP